MRTQSIMRRTAALCVFCVGPTALASQPRLDVCLGAAPPAACQETSYRYDEFGRLVQVTYPDTEDAGTSPENRYYCYDDASNRVRVSETPFVPPACTSASTTASAPNTITAQNTAATVAWDDDGAADEFIYIGDTSDQPGSVAYYNQSLVANSGRSIVTLRPDTFEIPVGLEFVDLDLFANDIKPSDGELRLTNVSSSMLADITWDASGILRVVPNVQGEERLSYSAVDSNRNAYTSTITLIIVD